MNKKQIDGPSDETKVITASPELVEWLRSMEPVDQDPLANLEEEVQRLNAMRVGTREGVKAAVSKTTKIIPLREKRKEVQSGSPGPSTRTRSKVPGATHEVSKKGKSERK